MMPPSARRLFAVTTLALFAVPSAVAETWTGAVDNNWVTQGNWDTNAVPVSGSAATFNSAGNGNTNISLAGSARATALRQLFQPRPLGLPGSREGQQSKAELLSYISRALWRLPSVGLGFYWR